MSFNISKYQYSLDVLRRGIEKEEWIPKREASFTILSAPTRDGIPLLDFGTYGINGAFPVRLGYLIDAIKDEELKKRLLKYFW